MPVNIVLFCGIGKKISFHFLKIARYECPQLATSFLGCFRRKNSSALQGRWPEGPEGFPMHKSDFSPFSDPFMLSVDASGVVPVGVRPPPPLRGSSPCEAGQFCHPHGEQRGRNDPPHGKQNGHYGRRMESRRGVTSRAEFIKSPLTFYCPQFIPAGLTVDIRLCGLLTSQ